MLVRSRKHGESICIDDTIQVSVLEVRGNRVRLGITAPLGVAIHRTELQLSLSAAKAVTAPITSDIRKAN